jgi:hypothetical protein
MKGAITVEFGQVLNGAPILNSVPTTVTMPFEIYTDDEEAAVLVVADAFRKLYRGVQPLMERA